MSLSNRARGWLIWGCIPSYTCVVCRNSICFFLSKFNINNEIQFEKNCMKTIYKIDRIDIFSFHLFSPLQTLRGTKLVRSMSTNPKREADNSRVGGISAVSGSGSGSGRRAKGGSNGASGRPKGRSRTRQNRSNVVAHVPAETLCSNPLKPCGACMEWLKKIAEVNPDFKVITFTDYHCGGVYIEDVAQIL